MIMATGLAVDYSIYFAQRFMHEVADGTRNGRVVAALNETGSAVFLGGEHADDRFVFSQKACRHIAGEGTRQRRKEKDSADRLRGRDQHQDPTQRGKRQSYETNKQAK